MGIIAFPASNSICLAPSRPPYAHRKRRFAVQKGTMLAFYSSEDERRRLGATPRTVLEVTAVRDWHELGADTRAFEVVYLSGRADRSTYECRADSKEARQLWVDALRHALDEPSRIAQDEIEDAQRELLAETEHQRAAVRAAADAVESATRAGQQQLESEAAVKQIEEEMAEIHAAIDSAQLLLEEAKTRVETTRTALARARAAAHDAAVGSHDDADLPDVSDQIARLAAQLEVESAAEETQTKALDELELRLDELVHDREQHAAMFDQHAQESQRLREAAGKSLEAAQGASRRRKLRIASWSSGDTAGAPGMSSQLDPLVEGYLQTKHPTRSSMHRRYYVLVGNTLCWYTDVNAYTARMDSPSGVVHVAAVVEWDGHTPSTGFLSPRSKKKQANPHAFGVGTVEGTTLLCSAPTRDSAANWTAALHISLTMPPLSPHRAVAAKARRDSFDLQAAATASSSSPRRQEHVVSAPQVITRPKPAKPGSAAEAAGSPTAMQQVAMVCVEGFLVRKSSSTSSIMMKKKYCVLRGLEFCAFDSHDAYISHGASEDQWASQSLVQVCAVSEWDGHGALLNYHHGFQVQAVNPTQTIFCSAANATEKSKWLHGIREALLKYRDAVLSPTRRQESMVRRAGQNLLQIASSSEFAGSAASEGDEYPNAAQEFQAMLEKYYAEHHPAKLHDVPMLVGKYRQRERMLIEHLDRIHGTALAEDARMVELLVKLAVPSTSPLLPRRGSVGLRSGLADFVSMTGYLAWDNEVTPSFCVLAINKLVRYRTQTHHETEPHAPLASFLISSVYEFPPPPSYREGLSSRANAGKSVFFLSGSMSMSPSSKEPDAATTVDLVLGAQTSEDKLRWMAKIRSGLGFAHAHSDSGGSPLSSPSAGVSPQKELAARQAALRRKLVDYYLQQNPRRVGEIDALLAYFAGRERQLLVSLDSTYGTAISHDDAYISLLPAMSPTAKSMGKPKGTTAHCESVLWVKHPSLGEAFQRCDCVLDGQRWSCYESEYGAEADDHQADREALLSDSVVGVHVLNAKLSEMFVFSVETLDHGVVLLRAETEALVNEWTRSLRSAVDAQQLLSAQREMESLPVGAIRDLFEMLTKFYRSHNPDKAGEVGTLMRAFRGRELQLLQEIDGIYHSQLASDPINQSLCEAAAMAESAVTPAGDDAGSAVLMEGYLVKRGHLMPSMRKRYCVLVGNKVTYFATQDDSRNPNAPSNGSFNVATVSDWDGHTNARVYEHGMELEAADGRSFFCAAPSSNEKQQWINALKTGITMAKANEAAAGGDRETADMDKAQMQARRAQLRDHLAQFYRDRNPKKIGDLDLLLSCYAGRELALLEAVDETYATSLAKDEELLALVSPSAKQSASLLSLQYDGCLKQAADGSWTAMQSVYVAVNELALSFFASREAFKSGISPPSQAKATLLTIKSMDGAARFAVETTEQKWLYFEASNAFEKRQWMLVLQAAIDTVLARDILNEEQESIQLDAAKAAALGSSDLPEHVATRGLLAVRMDLDAPDQLQTQPTAMKECYCRLENLNELAIWVEADASEEKRFRIVSTRGWRQSATTWPVTSDSTCRFPFQVVTDCQVVVSCSATSDLDRAKWIHQIRLGAEQAVALEMLEDQLLEAKEELKSRGQLQKLRLRGASSVSTTEAQPIVIRKQSATAEIDDDVLADVTTGTVAFRLTNTTRDSGIQAPKISEAPEAYLVLTERGNLSVYDSEAKCSDGCPPNYRGQVVEFERTPKPRQSPAPSPQRHMMKLFRLESATTSPSVSVVVQDSLSGPVTTRVAHLFLSSDEQHTLWVDAFTCCIGIRKGEALLHDEKMLLALESGRRSAREVTGANAEEEKQGDSAPTNAFVVQGAAMEGLLTQWNDAKSGQPPAKLSKTSTFAPAQPVYAVLIGCSLKGYSSRDNAPSSVSAQAGDGPTPVIDVVVTKVADWEVPSESTATTTESLGFQLDTTDPTSREQQTVMYFAAPTMPVKRDWVRVIHHEVDFALAEQYLDDDAKEFARQVAIDLTAAGASVESQLSVEGYVRVRHHFLGAVWRERFVVLRDTRLVIYASATDAAADSLSKRSLETHEIVGVDKWQPVFGGGALRTGERRFGFRVANEAGGFLECTVSSEDEATRWMTGISACIRDEADVPLSTGKALARDPALPFVADALMEGYLKLKDGAKRGKLAPPRLWRARYCVLMSTHLLIYESQQEAVASDASDGDVAPVAVHEVLSAVADPGAESAAEFSMTISAGGKLQAKAQSKLEVKRWLNAFDDAIAQAAESLSDVARAAEHHQEKAAAQEQVRNKLVEMRTDAMRQSMLLRDALQFMAAHSDEESNSDQYYETENSEDDNDDNQDDDNNSPRRQRNKADFLDRSPESSPMRRKVASGMSSFPFDRPGTDNQVEDDAPTVTSPFAAVFSCFFRCLPAPSGAPAVTNNKRSIAPLGLPGFPSSAALANPLYKCDYYKDDGYNPDHWR